MLQFPTLLAYWEPFSNPRRCPFEITYISHTMQYTIHPISHWKRAYPGYSQSMSTPLAYEMLGKWIVETRGEYFMDVRLTISTSITNHAGYVVSEPSLVLIRPRSGIEPGRVAPTANSDHYLGPWTKFGTSFTNGHKQRPCRTTFLLIEDIRAHKSHGYMSDG